MKLTEMRQVLADRGIHLTRSLGQNFLHDAKQLDRIVRTAEVQTGDRVLEIGPGLGPLTAQLVASGARVLAVEKDRRLVDVLRDHFKSVAGEGQAAGSAPLELLHADALRWIEDTPRDWRGWKIVANLPYAVASPILVEIAVVPSPPDKIVVTLQLEVARRLAAGPGSRDYGILSLLVQLRYAPRVCFTIPRDCFFPAPNVDSACVCLDRRAGELLEAAERPVFSRVVKRAFSERRKKALKLLKHDWPVAILEAAWAELGLDDQIRAERIRLDQFVQLVRRLSAAAVGRGAV